ncbi:hypothetical protein [uncultured Flavobacterium sp.]|uniref:hypothetical protein n=1 Tax=uncultured Flavobacterium sp. TaxID=165435 RepID=UPI0030EEE33F
MKLKRNSDNWLDIIIGTSLSFIYVIPFYVFILLYFHIEIKVYLFTIPFIYIIYKQWKSNHFSEFNTEFTEKKNSELLERVFKKMKCKSFMKYGEIKIEKTKIFHHPLDTTFQVRSKKIYYNFGYENLARGGRLTFLFGISTIQKICFLYHLWKEIKKNN